MREVRVDLVRMSLRQPGGEGKSKKKVEDERAVTVRPEKKIKLSGKRKLAGKDAAGDMRHQEDLLDLAEKKARIEVLAMLGLTEQVADHEEREVVKKENLRCQQQKPSERGCKKVEDDVEENLLMEMQDIFNDLHDLS